MGSRIPEDYNKSSGIMGCYYYYIFLMATFFGVLANVRNRQSYIIMISFDDVALNGFFHFFLFLPGGTGHIIEIRNNKEEAEP